MAQASYSLSTIPQVPGAKVAIIASKWYREISDRMIERCVPILRDGGCNAPDVQIVPGCLEIPLVARRLMQCDPSIEAIIVFGVILKGDTYHFDIVKDLCMSGLERVMFECDIPIINEILPVNRIEDAHSRSADDQKNKGLEAALAALEIMHWRRAHPLPAPTFS